MYETELGDTWDIIAKAVYGDEIYADVLMANNPFLLGTGIFSAGTLVYIPDLPAQTENTYPDWRD
jgi:phage tail protein X